MKSRLIILWFITFFLLYSCGEITSNNTQITIPDSNVSFQRHILPILKNTCGLSYCHGEIAPQGNVQIIDYISILNSLNGALVIPRNPDGSVLVQIIEYKLPHKPFLDWKLSANQINGIRKWILEGAKNN
ncbi:MAG: hypothetical protein N2560_03120 [Ignavibacteria bacterium]|nr:hypothetical protein [Ignavibacteria bacterium]